MTIKINWPLLATLTATLAGAAGTILTPMYGESLSNAVQAVLQALSGLLLIIPTVHASQIVVGQASTRRELARMEQQHSYDVALAAAKGQLAQTSGQVYQAAPQPVPGGAA